MEYLILTDNTTVFVLHSYLTSEKISFRWQALIRFNTIYLACFSGATLYIRRRLSFVNLPLVIHLYAVTAARGHLVVCLTRLEFVTTTQP